MEKITLKKQDITKLIQILKEQDEVEEPNDEIYIDSEELNRLLPAIDYNLNALSKLRKFKDKKIVINGDLKLRGKPVKSLGPIIRVNGNLDIVDTGIASIEGVQIAGRVQDWGSERAKIRERKRVAGLMSEAQSRREDDDWNIENGDPEGLAAHAVIKVMEYNDENVRTEEETEELRGLKERLGNLYYDQEQGNESDELSDEISEIEGRIEEIEEKYDVYDLVPSRHKYYGNLYRFDLEWGAAKGNEYAAGKEEDAEAAALEYAEQWIDENGVRGFNENFWMDHLDEEGILDYFRDFYEDDIRNNTEVYFDDDDFELTTEQEARKEQLESYIEEMEDLLSETEEEQRNLEDSDSEEYYDLDEKIKEIESNIETAQEELDGIEPDKEPTEDMIERKVDDMLDDVKYDYAAKLDEFGLDIEDWVDKSSLAQAYVDSDGYGIMSGYDGSYETEYINEVAYIVMRIN
jgi:hypothetical protein